MASRFATLCLVLFLAPLTGSIGVDPHPDDQWTHVIPEMTPIVQVESDWLVRNHIRRNRNGIP